MDVKRSRPVLVIITLLLLSPLFSGTQSASAQQAIPSGLLPPVSIILTPIPNQLPPGGSGVVVVQLVDANGNPSPARQDVTVNLFSSEPTVASVSQQVTVTLGKSHAEAQVKAGTEGSAELTAAANGFLSGSAKFSTLVFNDFELQLAPMNDPVSPGDTLHLRVGLLASGRPFETPEGVQISIAASLRSTSQQSVEVQPGASDAYVSIPVPSGSSLTTPYMTITAAAAGFVSATAAISLSPQGANPQEAMVGPPRANLTAGSTEFLSVSLFNGTFAPASGSTNLDLFSSNASVVQPQVTQVTLSGTDSATFPVYANATGTAQITAIAPGLASVPLTVTVLAPFKPSLGLSLPPKVRAGETYSFSVGFYDGTEPVPYGPVPVYLSSSDLNLTVPSSVDVSALGYVVGTFTALGTGAANFTAVAEGANPATMITVSILVPAVVQVAYTVEAQSYTGPMIGIPVNFTYDGRTTSIATGLSGSASFLAYNDTAAVVAVPTEISLDSVTYYFTGWSNGAKSENVSLLAASPVYSVTAEYFRSVVPTTYSVEATSDGHEPLGGLHFSVSSAALKENMTLSTDAKGRASFVLPNDSSFSLSVPELYQPSGQTRYALLTLENSTRSVVNVTAAAATTIEAVYATYYQFQVTSPIGNTTGSGWYRSGTSAAYSIDETSSGGPLVYQRFSGWTGSFSSGQPSGSKVITSPAFITAQWSTDDSPLFAVVATVLAGAAVAGLFVFKLRRKLAPS
jgi:hypothetical protein